ncbi:hypothetical protein KCU90_g8, partial [Aureobasidium melanogenum]
LEAQIVNVGIKCEAENRMLSDDEAVESVGLLQLARRRQTYRVAIAFCPWRTETRVDVLPDDYPGTGPGCML